MQTRDSQPFKNLTPNLQAQLERLSPQKQPLAQAIIASLENPAMKDPRNTINTILNQPEHLALRNDEDIQKLAVDLLLFCQHNKQLWLTAYKLPSPFEINPESLHHFDIQPDGSLSMVGSSFTKATIHHFYPTRGTYIEENLSFSNEADPEFWTFRASKIIKFPDGRVGAVYTIDAYNIFFRIFEYKDDTLVPADKRVWDLPVCCAWDYSVHQADYYEAVNCVAVSLRCDGVVRHLFVLDLDNVAIHELTLDDKYNYFYDYKLHTIKNKNRFEIIARLYGCFLIYEIDREAKTCTLVKKSAPWVQARNMSHDGSTFAIEIALMRTVSFFETKDAFLPVEQAATKARLCLADDPLHVGSHWMFDDYFTAKNYSAKTKSPQLFSIDTLTQYTLMNEFPPESAFIAMPLQNAFYVITAESVTYCALTESIHKPPMQSQTVSVLSEILPQKMSLDVIKVITGYYVDVNFSITITPARLDYSSPRMLPRETQSELHRYTNAYQQAVKRKMFNKPSDPPCEHHAELMKNFTDELNNLTYDNLTVKNLQEICEKFLATARAMKLNSYDLKGIEEFIRQAIADLEKNPWPVLNIRNAFRFFHIKVNLPKPQMLRSPGAEIRFPSTPT